MRMQTTPSSTGAEPVVYAPKVTFPAFRRLDEEDASAHLAHPPASSTFQPWPTTAHKTEPQTQTQTHPKQPKRDVFVCPEVHCGKQFPRSFALRRHMRIHTGTKPYACDYQGCAQRFNTSGNLSRHKRIHSGERPYPCCFETCGKRFNTSTKLKRHLRIHFPDGQNLFRCTEAACAWACDNYKEYVQHQKLHSSVAEGFGNDENVDNNGRSPKTDFQQPSDVYQDRRMYAAPSLVHKEETDYRRVGSGPKSFLDERVAPRLPFPTRAFPSETVGMPSTGLLGSSFHPLTHLPRYYDSASSEMATSSTASYATAGSYASTHVPYSYLRGEPVSSYQSTSTTTSFMSSSEPYSQPMRQEDVDRQYESSSPHEMRHHSPPQQTQTGYAGSANSGMNPVPAEFTGEELSAVLELMKDS